MRIAQVATVATPVSSGRCGSVESLVYLLARDLIRIGHEVTVFAAAGSDPPGELIATLPGPYGENGSPDDWQVCEWMNLCQAVKESERFDVVHLHAYLWGLPLEPLARCPMVHTMHVLPAQANAALWRATPQACVTAISYYQWAAFPDLIPAAVVPHGVDPARHQLCAEPDDYLCFLGRFTPGKGVLEAIAAARAVGMRLLLAAPLNDFYRQQVEPHVDGHHVEYVGYLQPAERDALLGGARALLYPIQAPEPFGLVLVESMMSGTPVAALGLGAVPEIVDEGVTGAWEPPGGDVGAALRRCLELDRARVREHAVERFSPERMATGYEAAYARIAGGVR